MKKIKLLGKLLIFIFVFTLMGNVYAETGDFVSGTKMDEKGFESYKLILGKQVYLRPLYNLKEPSSQPEDQSTERITDDDFNTLKANIVTTSEGTIYNSSEDNLRGLGVKFDANIQDNSGVYNFTNGEYVLFKKLYKIGDKFIDVKVTPNKLTSSINKNRIKIYVNGTYKHRYLGISIVNSENLSQQTKNIEDMLEYTINLYEAGTNTPYKNEDVILYYSDIDANITNKQYELAKIFDVKKDNIYLAAQDKTKTELYINGEIGANNINNSVISSKYHNTGDSGWSNTNTQKVSMVISKQLDDGEIKLGFGHYIDKDTFNSSSAALSENSVRFGGTDVQFLVPQSITGSKTYATDTLSGKDNTMVVVNDEIKYNINIKPNASWSDEITITDKLSKGLKYKTGSAKVGTTATEPTITNNNDGTTTLVWKINLKSETNLTYSAQVVNGYVNNKVSNKAVAKIGDIEYNLGELENPLPSKKYASDTPNGKDGAKVKKGDVIKYSITYKNSSLNKEKVKVTDTLSKGIKYKKNTAKIGSIEIEPKITENKDGTTTLVWEKEVAANTEENLTYSVDVVGGVSEVKNNAYLQYAKLKSDSTTEFDSYGDKINLNELRNPLDVVVPNTALNSSIYLILIGMLLIGTGAIVIRKTTKKESK